MKAKEQRGDGFFSIDFFFQDFLRILGLPGFREKDFRMALKIRANVKRLFPIFMPKYKVIVNV